MPGYRIFFMDEKGGIAGREEGEYLGDQEVIAQILIKHPNVRLEIWLGQRQVAQLDGIPRPPMKVNW